MFRVQAFKDDPVDLLADGHLDVECFALSIEFPRCIDTLGLLADGLKRLGEILAPANGETYPAVSGLIIGAGQDQVPQACQAHEGIGPPAKRLTKPGKLGEPTRNEGSSGVGAESESIADACGNSHHVLDRAAELDAPQIGTGIDPGTLIPEPGRNGGSVIVVFCGDGQCAGESPATSPAKLGPETTAGTASPPMTSWNTSLSSSEVSGSKPLAPQQI